MRATGKPHASLTLSSSSTRLSCCGISCTTIAIDVLRLNSPARTTRQAPVDWQRNANTRTRNMAPACKAPFFVMLVELEAARSHIAAACPGINRFFEHAHCGTEFVECSVPSDQVTAVRKTVRKSARMREQH